MTKEIGATDMRQIAQVIDALLNGTDNSKDKTVGFVLLTFPFNATDGQANYISNGASRKDMIAFLKETAARFEGQSLQGGNA